MVTTTLTQEVHIDASKLSRPASEHRLDFRPAEQQADGRWWPVLGDVA